MANVSQEQVERVLSASGRIEEMTVSMSDLRTQFASMTESVQSVLSDRQQFVDAINQLKTKVERVLVHQQN